jgi:hypothetical protein
LERGIDSPIAVDLIAWPNTSLPDFRHTLSTCSLPTPASTGNCLDAMQ